MNALAPIPLPDIQASTDHRQLAIQQVGIKDIRFPIVVAAGNGGKFGTVARLTMTVGLAPDVKGTHMSRFVEALEAHRGEWRTSDFAELLADVLRRLAAVSGRIEATFPYFIRKAAPVSGAESLLDYDVAVVAEKKSSGEIQTTLRVTAPVTSLCPCSKQISDYGAHNQRSAVSIAARLRAPLTVEDLVGIAESEASCEVFGLLKRGDEKWVTERAYDNPKFVEDMVRDVAARLMADARVAEWSVESENFESIHNHSAFARLEGINQ